MDAPPSRVDSHLFRGSAPHSSGATSGDAACLTGPGAVRGRRARRARRGRRRARDRTALRSIRRRPLRRRVPDRGPARRRRRGPARGLRAGLARGAAVRGRPRIGGGLAHDDRPEPGARSGAGPEPAGPDDRLRGGGPAETSPGDGRFRPIRRSASITTSGAGRWRRRSDPEPAPAPGDRAGVLRGSVAVGDRRAAPGAARHGEDAGAAGHAEAGECLRPFSSSVEHDRPGPRLAARPGRRLRARGAGAGRGAAVRGLPGRPSERSGRWRSTATWRRCWRWVGGSRRPVPTSANGYWRGSARTRARRCRPGLKGAGRRRGSRSRPASSLAVGLGAGLLSALSLLAAIETELAARDLMLAQTREQLTEREATLNSILEPGVQLSSSPPAATPSPASSFLGSRAASRIVHGYRLKPVPAGQAYQLWFIKDGKPVPSVTFKPEADGHARVEQIPVPAGRQGQRRGDHRRARGRLGPADLAHRDGGNAAEVLSPDVYRPATMAAARNGGPGDPAGRRASAACSAGTRGPEIAARARRVRGLAHHRAYLAARRHRPAANRHRAPRSAPPTPTCHSTGVAEQRVTPAGRGGHAHGGRVKRPI